MEKLDGENLNLLMPSLTAGQKSGIMFQLGEFNKQINSIVRDKFGCLVQPNNQSDSWKTVFLNLISDILNDGKDAAVSLPVSYTEIEGIVKANAHACDDVTTPALIHWDLWKGNILVCGEQISGIIDFERALYADYLMEHSFRGKANNDFCTGYGVDVTTLDANAKIRLKLYDLYLALIWVIECYYRDYDRARIEKREENLVEKCNAFAKMEGYF